MRLGRGFTAILPKQRAGSYRVVRNARQICGLKLKGTQNSHPLHPRNLCSTYIPHLQFSLFAYGCRGILQQNNSPTMNHQGGLGGTLGVIAQICNA